jgi:hypothetical protein
MATNPSGLKAHGSSCLKSMAVLPAHVGRKHKACTPKDKTRKQGSCVITAGLAPAPVVA